MIPRVLAAWQPDSTSCCNALLLLSLLETVRVLLEPLILLSLLIVLLALSVLALWNEREVLDKELPCQHSGMIPHRADKAAKETRCV